MEASETRGPVTDTGAQSASWGDVVAGLVVVASCSLLLALVPPAAFLAGLGLLVLPRTRMSPPPTLRRVNLVLGWGLVVASPVIVIDYLLR
jgi:hypothetical protein